MARASGAGPSHGVRIRATRRSLRSGASARRTSATKRGSVALSVGLLKTRPKDGGRGASSSSSSFTARTASMSGGTTDSSRRSPDGTPSQSVRGRRDRATSHQRSRSTARPQEANMGTDYQRIDYQRIVCPGLSGATRSSTP